MEKRYSALRTIGTIFKILGVLIAIFAVLSALGVCATLVVGGASLPRESAGGLGAVGGTVAGIIISVLDVLIGIIWAVMLFAFGDFIYVLLSIEENTRATSAMLRAPAAPPAATTYPPPPLR